MKHFLVLDGSSLMFRAFYALPLLTDSRGEYTNAIFGFSNMLTKLMAERQPDYMVIAFDKSRHTFRTERYAAYKGTRKPTPEEMKSQIPLLQELSAAMGIKFLELDNYEADDIIGTLSTQAAAQDIDVMVITGDRDALQLIRPNLRVLFTRKGISDIVEYDEATFQAEYGIEPIRLIDMKGLMGDSSDNIPGVPKVGPKTAQKLLQQFGSLESVLEHIPEVAGKKLQERLNEHADQARLSKELATICLSVPGLEFAEAEYTVNPDRQRMREFCDRYELKKVWQNFQHLFPEAGDEEITLGLEDASHDADPTYEAWDEAAVVQQHLQAAEALGLAGVFTGRAPFERLTGMAVALPDGTAGWIDAESPVFPALLTEVERLATASSAAVRVFGLKKWYQSGLKPGRGYLDCELAAYLLNPEQTKYELPALSLEFFPEDIVPEEFASEPEQAVWQARLLVRLGNVLLQQMQEHSQLPLYDDIELPLVPVLADMEQNGIYINREALAEKATDMGKDIADIEQDIYALAGEEFNINSPKQLGEVLFERLGLTGGKKTKTGYSTKAEILESIRYEHPIIEQILRYRTLAKLKSTYLDSLGDLINPETGRIHTSFNQTVTATGRLSSSNPNLQNIPVRTEEGRTIRMLFEPGSGYDELLSADYSQIELRLLAHMSDDKDFIAAFCNGEDIHARTAAEVFGVPLAEVTPEQRRHAKAVNFGIVYGISDYGLSRDLHISRKAAAGYIDSYFARYPGIKTFMDDMVATARDKGYAETMYGRRRYLPALRSRNYMQRSLAERMAMNTPIQGSAADIIKLAMIRAWQGLRAARLKSRILLQVHDELVLEIVDTEKEQVESILREAMEQVAELQVPLVIDIHSGRNWAEAK